MRNISKGEFLILPLHIISATSFFTILPLLGDDIEIDLSPQSEPCQSPQPTIIAFSHLIVSSEISDAVTVNDPAFLINSPLENILTH